MITNLINPLLKGMLLLIAFIFIYCSEKTDTNIEYDKYTGYFIIHNTTYSNESYRMNFDLYDSTNLFRMNYNVHVDTSCFNSNLLFIGDTLQCSFEIANQRYGNANIVKNRTVPHPILKLELHDTSLSYCFNFYPL